MFEIEAPAKINLTLEVLGKRPDGYHEIRSVIQTISLCDILRFSNGNSIEIHSMSPGWMAEYSLIPKAINLLRTITGYKGGVIIEVEKHIPLTAGLGGDSSCAAAVLRGLNELWGLALPQDKLMELAPQLGSDVAYFIKGGTALMEGRGEKITLLPPFPHHYATLVNPAIPHPSGKTGLAYGSLKPSYFTDGDITRRLVADLKKRKKFNRERLFNTFENVFFTQGAELLNYCSHILKIGAPFVHLVGSGPSLYTLLKDKDRAEDLNVRLKNYGMESYLTEIIDFK